MCIGNITAIVGDGVLDVPSPVVRQIPDKRAVEDASPYNMQIIDQNPLKNINILENSKALQTLSF